MILCTIPVSLSLKSPKRSVKFDVKHKTYEDIFLDFGGS